MLNKALYDISINILVDLYEYAQSIKYLRHGFLETNDTNAKRIDLYQERWDKVMERRQKLKSTLIRPRVAWEDRNHLENIFSNIFKLEDELGSALRKYVNDSYSDDAEELRNIVISLPQNDVFGESFNRAVEEANSYIRGKLASL